MLRDHAPAFVTRSAGRLVRDQLVHLHQTLPPEVLIELDFTGVDVLTPSFADECLGRLVAQLGLETFKRRFALLTDNADWQALINSVVRNRLQLDRHDRVVAPPTQP